MSSMTTREIIKLLSSMDPDSVPEIQVECRHGYHMTTAIGGFDKGLTVSGYGLPIQPAPMNAEELIEQVQDLVCDLTVPAKMAPSEVRETLVKLRDAIQGAIDMNED